jgi:hypothetical protein
MPVGETLGQMAVELIHVQPKVGAGVQANDLPVDVQPFTGEGLSEGREGTTESGPPVGSIVLGPEQVDQRIAPVAFSRDDNVSQKGDGFGCVHLDRLAVALDAGRAEQVQA